MIPFRRPIRAEPLTRADMKKLVPHPPLFSFVKSMHLTRTAITLKEISDLEICTAE